jgi:ATP-binding cassette, subfamily B, bacterial
VAQTTTSRRRALTALIRPDARRWALLAVLIAAASAGALAGPLIVRRIVDEATNGTTVGDVVRLAVLFLVVAIATQVLNVVVVRSATVAAWRITNGLRLDITRHVLGLDHEFHRKHTPGELIQRVDGDVTNVSNFLSQVVPKVAGAAIMLSGMLAVLTVLDWPLGVGMLVYLGLSIGLVLSMRHRAVRESSDEMGTYAKLYGGIEERLTAVEDLRANGAENHAMWRFVEDSTEAITSAVRREAAFLRMWWALQIDVAIGLVGTLALSAALVSNGAITLGTAFLLIQYVHLMIRPLEELADQLEVIQKANGAMHRVVDLLAIEPTIIDRGATSPRPGPLSVSCRGVGFTYDDVQPILHDVDVEVAEGCSVGVVGRTGSGKTTFSRLLLRLVEATDGCVALGGVPIADIPLAELRRRVALVPQEVELFEGTIRDNVTLFDPAPTDADVKQALRHAGLAALVDTGIDRPLGSAGAGLSAGQAQLLALARVWLRDPDLVVLDEATARVDPETERRIAKAIGELMRGRTTFVIAHRLSTLDMVDEVIVFDHGRIAEHGDRTALVDDRDSHFRHLLELALAVESDLVAEEAPVDGFDGLAEDPSLHRVEADVQ